METNYEAEEMVIGAILIDKDSMANVIEFLTPEMFSNPNLKTIFANCLQMDVLGTPIDLVTLTYHLRGNNALNGGLDAYFITSLTNRLVSSANIEIYGRIIHEKYILREVRKIVKLVEVKASEEGADCFEIIEQLDKQIYDLTKVNNAKKTKTIIDLYFSQIKDIEKKKEGSINGLLTGIAPIDNILNGIKKQNLIILAARPGQGKTALVMSISRNISVTGVPVGFFSMEMSCEELCNRFTSINSSIPLDFLTNSNVTGVHFDKLMGAISQVKGTPLYIDDSPALTLVQLRNRARKMVQTYGIKLLVIDYIGLMRPEAGQKGRTKENEVSEISAGLKALAKELNMPIICLSQLSRKVEERPSKVPQLSDLRDSGSIEQDADIVIFLMRPQYYDMDVKFDGETNIYFAKNRNGITGSETIQFTKELTKFSSIKTEYELQLEYSVYGKDVENKDLF